MKRVFHIIAALSAFLTSCSHVDESERLIYVKPAQVSRHVLIEDFTGQRCVNCPMATAEIVKLQEQYGADNVIAVGIHSGPLGFAGNAKAVGFMTDLGNAYYNYWQVEDQPAGVINRNGGVLNYTDWQTKVYNELQKKAPLSLTIDNNYDPSTRQLTILVMAQGTDGNTEGKLQLWLTENDLTALQVRYNTISDAGSGQISDANYIHNHVLRDAVNGPWGNDITLREGVLKGYTYTYTLDERWTPDNMNIVAFVYNDEGVQQVAQSGITQLK